MKRVDDMFGNAPLTRHQWLAVVGLLAVAFALRVAWLWETELWWDEILTVHRARLPLGDLWRSLNTQAAFEASVDTSPPLHHIIIHFFMLLGNQEAAVKLSSAIFGTASIAMAFAVGSRCFGRLAGFLGAAYLTLLQYHIAVSRDLRWYSFFFFFSLASLYAFIRCVSPGRRRDAVAWVLASAAMLYTSYVAAPFLAGQAIFAAAVLVCWHRAGRRADCVRFIKTMTVAATALVLLYLPQLPGQLVTTRVFYIPGLNPSSPIVLIQALGKFAGFWSDLGGYFAAAAMVVSLWGGIAAWRGGRGGAVALLLLWGGLPTGIAFLVNVNAQAQAKYFPGLLFLLGLFVGAGLAALADTAARLLGGRSWVAVAVGLASVVALAWPNLDYAKFYRPAQPTTKLWAAFLHSEDVRGLPLVLERNRQRKAILDWYFAGKTPWLSRSWTPGYKRFVYLGSQPKTPENLSIVKILRQPTEMAAFAQGEVLSESPVALYPDPAGQARYQEDFTGFSLWRRAAFVDNLAPDFSAGTLALVGFDAPGQVVYAFANPTGARLEAVTLTLRMILQGTIAGYAPDANAALEASADGEHWQSLVNVTYETFLKYNPGMTLEAPLRSAQATLTTPVPASLLNKQRLFVRLVIRPGGYGASIEVAALSLDANFAADSQAQAVDPAVERCRTLAANAPLRQAQPGVRPLEGNILYGFSPLAEAIDPRMGNQESLDVYAAVSSDEPLLRVTRPDGSEVCRFYDPLRNGSGVALITGRPVSVAVGPPVPATIKGLRLEGEIAEPVISFGRERLAPGLSLPKGSSVVLNPGGKGLITFLQSFAAEQPPVDILVSHAGLAEKTSGRSITCRAGSPCEFVYLFASKLPITGFRLTATPSVSPDGEQHVRAFYALDDPGDRRTVFEYRGEGSGRWDSYENLTRQVTLSRPGHLLYIGFSLSGDGASVAGADTYPLRMEVDLDARRLECPTLVEELTTIQDESAYPNAYRLWLSRDRLTF